MCFHLAIQLCTYEYIYAHVTVYGWVTVLTLECCHWMYLKSIAVYDDILWSVESFIGTTHTRFMGRLNVYGLMGNAKQ